MPDKGTFECSANPELDDEDDKAATAGNGQQAEAGAGGNTTIADEVIEDEAIEDEAIDL